MSRTVASHPAKVRVEVGHFLKCDGKDLIILIGALVLGTALLLVSWKGALIVVGIGVFIFISSISTARTLFQHGDVCPAVVLDPERELVAVMTDLAQGKGPKPALKVLRQPLRKAVQGEVKKGTRLGYVALYSGSAGAPAWTNFGGYLLNTGTRSQKTIDRIVAEISRPTWESLIAAARQLEQPYATGFFDVKSGSGTPGEAARLVPRPSPFRVSPIVAIAGAVVLLPVLGLVGLAVLGKIAARGNNAPAPEIPAGPVAQADPVDPVVEPPPGMHGHWPGQNPHVPPGFRPREFPPGDPRQGNPAQENPFQPRPGQNFDGPNGRQPGPMPNEATSPPGAETDENPFQPKSDPAAEENPFQPRGNTSTPASGNRRSVGGPDWMAGMKGEVMWGAQWLPVTILEVLPDGRLKVHWDGYSDNFDEVMERSRVRTPANSPAN